MESLINGARGRLTPTVGGSHATLSGFDTVVISLHHARKYFLHKHSGKDTDMLN